MLNTYRLTANRPIQLIASADSDAQLVNVDTVANVYVAEDPSVSALAGYPVPPLSSVSVAAGSAVWVTADAPCTVVLSDTVSGYDNPGALASNIASQVATRTLAITAPNGLPILESAAILGSGQWMGAATPSLISLPAGLSGDLSLPGAWYNVSQYESVVINLHSTDVTANGKNQVTVFWTTSTPSANPQMIAVDQFTFYNDPIGTDMGPSIVLPVKGPRMGIQIATQVNANTVMNALVAAQTQAQQEQCIVLPYGRNASGNMAVGATANINLSCVDGKIRLTLQGAGTTGNVLAATLFVLHPAPMYYPNGVANLIPTEMALWASTFASTVQSFELDLPRGASCRLQITNNDTIVRAPQYNLLHVGRV